jgi:hypothetical protein
MPDSKNQHRRAVKVRESGQNPYFDCRELEVIDPIGGKAPVYVEVYGKVYMGTGLRLLMAPIFGGVIGVIGGIIAILLHKLGVL